MEDHPTPAPPPLRRIHLSTLLVMTLIAGAWMVQNFREYEITAFAKVAIDDYHEESVTKAVRTRGFPLQIHSPRGVRGWHGPADIYMSFDVLSLVLNCVCGMFVMGGVAYAMEWSLAKHKT